MAPDYMAFSRRQAVARIERDKARGAVSLAIREGRLSAPTSQPCVTCGGASAQYHHYLGYAPENWLDVKPYCRPCHRAEHSRLSREGVCLDVERIDRSGVTGPYCNGMQAMAYLGISQTRLKELCERGRIPFELVGARQRRRYRVTDLDAFAESVRPTH